MFHPPRAVHQKVHQATRRESFMSISSVSGASSAAHTQAVQRQPEAAEVKKPGPDGDKDDGASKVQPEPAPSVNTSGQVVGQVINTTA
jgi:hypothetical protein